MVFSDEVVECELTLLNGIYFFDAVMIE